MEINPRFWASLELAVVSGVDFPYLYYKIAVEGDCEEVFTYKAGVRVRWLLPGDLLHFIFSPDRFRLNPPFICGRQNNVIDDTFAWNDLLPSLGVIFACFLFFFNKNKRKFIFNR